MLLVRQAPRGLPKTKGKKEPDRLGEIRHTSTLLSCSLSPCLTGDKSEAEEMDAHIENQEVRTRFQTLPVSE